MHKTCLSIVFGAGSGGGVRGRLTNLVMKLLGRPVGLDQPLFLIAGPRVVESEELRRWSSSITA